MLQQVSPLLDLSSVSKVWLVEPREQKAALSGFAVVFAKSSGVVVNSNAVIPLTLTPWEYLTYKDLQICGEKMYTRSVRCVKGGACVPSVPLIILPYLVSQ